MQSLREFHLARLDAPQPVTRMPARRSLPAVLSVAAVFLLAGCSGQDYRSEDFIGTFTDTGGGVLTLHDDGGYELSGIAVSVLDGEDGAGSIEEPVFTGTWDLVLSEASSDWLDLRVDEGGETYTSANIQVWFDSADRLYVFPNGVDNGPLHYLDRRDQP